jgi:hypothetical protein
MLWTHCSRKVLGVLSAEGLIALKTVMHDGTKVAAHAGRGSFRHEEQIQKHLEAARDHVAAMGDPRRDAETPRQTAARTRARRERIERLEQAVAEVAQIRAAKRPGYTKTAFLWPRQSRDPARDGAALR